MKVVVVNGEITELTTPLYKKYSGGRWLYYYKDESGLIRVVRLEKYSPRFEVSVFAERTSKEEILRELEGEEIPEELAQLLR